MVYMISLVLFLWVVLLDFDFYTLLELDDTFFVTPYVSIVFVVCP